MSISLLPIILGVFGLVLFFFLMVAVLGSLYQKAGPNKRLVQAGMEIHTDELMADGELASQGETVFSWAAFAA